MLLYNMTSPTPIAVLVRHRTNAALKYQTHLSVGTLSTFERLKSGFMFLGLSLLVAALFALVPILHFILVPIAFLGGLFLFFKNLQISDYRFTSPVKCPQCEKSFELKAGSFTWPMKENCPECRAEIRIEPSQT